MSLRIHSLLNADGALRLSLDAVEPPTPSADQVLVRIEAAPINPSDLGVLMPRLHAEQLQQDGAALVGQLPTAALAGMQARFGKALPVGNEGAGTVVAAGEDPVAQALLGKTVAIYGGGTFAEHRVLPAAQCLPLAEGLDAKAGASNFVNPMTVLGMLETMRLEGHTALVHTAAASNLGQMLAKACAADGVPLVAVVRRDEHVELLRRLGASHVVNSSAPSFLDDLTEACAQTGATLAFDAIGGGELADQLLTAMERAAQRGAESWSPYGSTTPKQVYVYGALDRRPLALSRAYGMTWGVGGWLIGNLLARLERADVVRLRTRVARELGTTFASEYTAELGLAELLDLPTLQKIARMATGEKYLLRPTRS